MQKKRNLEQHHWGKFWVLLKNNPKGIWFEKKNDDDKYTPVSKSCALEVLCIDALGLAILFWSGFCDFIGVVQSVVD